MGYPDPAERVGTQADIRKSTCNNSSQPTATSADATLRSCRIGCMLRVAKQPAGADFVCKPGQHQFEGLILTAGEQGGSRTASSPKVKLFCDSPAFQVRASLHKADDCICSRPCSCTLGVPGLCTRHIESAWAHALTGAF